MKRDCVCPRANHQHGTWLAYNNDRCRCTPCQRAWAAYTRHMRHRQHRGGGQILIDGTGTARRLQALAAVGWGIPDVAALLGYTSDSILYTWRAGGTRIRRETARQIAAVYDAVWDKPTTSPYPVKVRRYAQRNGWLPPLAWDDDEIDDPTATAHTPGDGGWDHKPCGTTAAARRHYRRGEPLCAACLNAQRRERKAA